MRLQTFTPAVTTLSIFFPIDLQLLGSLLTATNDEPGSPTSGLGSADLCA
jgi:hypothetical protein